MKRMSAKRRIFAFVSLILTIGIICFIFSQSSATAEVSSRTSGRFVTFFNNVLSCMGLPPFLNQNIVRTLAHLAEFFALGFTASVTSGAFLGFKKLSFILAVAVSSLTSVTDEYIQLFSEGRAFQFKDLLVDNTGIILGSVTVFLGIYVFNFLKNRRGKNDKG